MDDDVGTAAECHQQPDRVIEVACSEDVGGAQSFSRQLDGALTGCLCGPVAGGVNRWDGRRGGEGHAECLCDCGHR